MSAVEEHANPRQPVTAEQRELAENWLQEAYADGRISEDEFDQRIGHVISAANRQDLNEAFLGLAPVTPSFHGARLAAVDQPATRSTTPTQGDRGVAAVAHWSPFVLWIFGPLLVYALTQPDSYARREAAKAFNFQLASTLAGVGGAVLAALGGWWIFGWLLSLALLAWVVLTIVGGVKAVRGDDWANPVKRVVPWEPLSEG